MSGPRSLLPSILPKNWHFLYYYSQQHSVLQALAVLLFWGLNPAASGLRLVVCGSLHAAASRLTISSRHTPSAVRHSGDGAGPEEDAGDTPTEDGNVLPSSATRNIQNSVIYSGCACYDTRRSVSLCWSGCRHVLKILMNEQFIYTLASTSGFISILFFFYYSFIYELICQCYKS